MAIIEGWLPPNREHWELACFVFQFFPLVTIFQWIQPWYSAGKTSVPSRFNVPGKSGWITMEVPGFLIVLYCVYTLPQQLGIEKLPLENLVLTGLFVIHYLYRAILAPVLTPSISEMHIFVWILGFSFQVLNGISIGGWLAGYGGYTQPADWNNHKTNYIAGARMELGLMIWAVGFLGNIFHDDELREIRRAALRIRKRRAEEAEKSTGKDKQNISVDKVYMIPKNGLFWFILFPHYLMEWFEWTGYWIMGGMAFTPGRTFLVNEVATMLPRALQGKRWYIERFGVEKLEGRTALIPGLL